MNGSTSEYVYLDNSPMFKLSLSSKELFHSNFLEWLSAVDREMFKDVIDKMTGCKIAWPKVWRVKREYNNFDLCIVAYDQYDDSDDERISDDPDFRILVVIENKVKSIPYKEQLDRYREEAGDKNAKYWKWRLSKIVGPEGYDGYSYDNGRWWGMTKHSNGRGRKADWYRTALNDLSGVGKLEKEVLSKTEFTNHFVEQNGNDKPIRFVLLSLADSFPDLDAILGEKVWEICNYETYGRYVRDAFSGLQKGLNKDIVYDYCEFITKLSGLSKRWETEDYGYGKRFLYYTLAADGKTRRYNDNYKEARRRRIHDLYQKLKFSRLCTDLFNDVKKIYGKGYEVFPNNRKGLFKKDDAWGRDKNYICVNYAYLHGEPLLEVNVHPALISSGEEIYYTVQVQGSAYEHGIQLIRKSSGNTEEDAKTVEADLKKGSIPVIPKWMNIHGTNEWNGCSQEDFNRFGAADGIYLYQKVSLLDQTTGEVMKQMLDDVAQIIFSKSL